MYKSESIKELAGALAKAQAEFRPAEMNAKNPFLKNKYADLGAIIETSRPALTKNGLSVSQLVGGNADSIELETILIHSTGEFISSIISFPVGEKKGLSLAQNAGAIITYMRRYQLASMLGIYADEDSDGNGSAPTGYPAGTTSAQQAQPQNGNREPLDPEILADMLEKKANTHAGRECSDKQRGLLAGTLSQIFIDENDRHSVQEYLLGVTSLNDAPDEVVIAALDWLKPEKDGDGKWQPNMVAEKEAHAVLRHVLKEQGQKEMDL